uniref:Uncharacterized protein n=1 Tax=Rhizophora mucronata TaxID=61149 RepID=A0A2P2QZ19_RHIMU
MLHHFAISTLLFFHMTFPLKYHGDLSANLLLKLIWICLVINFKV